MEEANLTGIEGQQSQNLPEQLTAAERSEWMEQWIAELQKIRRGALGRRWGIWWANVIRILGLIYVTVVICLTIQIATLDTLIDLLLFNIMDSYIEVAGRWLEWIIGTTCAIGLAIISIVCWRAEKRYEIEMRRRTALSGIIEQMALGPQYLATIYNWTPWPWSYWLGLRPKGLVGWFRLVTYNLDWYLTEPRRLLRPAWIMTVVGFVLVLSDLITRIITIRISLGALMAMSSLAHYRYDMVNNLLDLIGPSGLYMIMLGHSVAIARIWINADCLLAHMTSAHVSCATES